VTLSELGPRPHQLGLNPALYVEKLLFIFMFIQQNSRVTDRNSMHNRLKTCTNNTIGFKI